jgi:hydroxymethylglutaryl-CoA reductase (NADPH)
MQVANVVAAFFAATGQDLAHVVEAAQASTTFEKDGDDVYVAVTFPNLNVGTVGGGTGLATQAQARSLIRQNKNSVNSIQLVSVLAGAALAAEISGLAALATQTLAQAHQKFGRGQHAI